MSEAKIFSDIDRILEKLNEQRVVRISGLWGPTLSIFIFEFSKKVSPVVFVTTTDRVERFGSEISNIVPDTDRIDDNHPFFYNAKVIITTAEYLDKKIKEKENLKIIKNGRLDLEELLKRLEETGYNREELVEEEYEYALRGGILDFFEPGHEPIRIELVDDTVYSIRNFDTQTQRSTGVIDECVIKLAKPDFVLSLKDVINKNGIVVTEQIVQTPLPQLLLQDPGDFEFHFSRPRKYFGDLKALQNDINQGNYTYKFLINPSLTTKLSSVIGLIECISLPLREGFVDEERKIVYLTETEIFGLLPRKKPKFKGLFIDDLKGLKINDYVVHNDYGIGQFKSLVQIDFEGKKVECLRIDYAGSDKVYLPVERLNLLERYIGSEGRPPKLSRIGSDLWFKTKERVKKATEILAQKLINLYARRRLSPGFRFSPDSLEMQELEAGFLYEETPDQKRAIEDVKRDMESPKPQERLICGDVGFGKTEIALRAAFKTTLDGKQTMLLCPTTLLAFQHYNTFINRLKNFPVWVAMISRFKKRTELNKIFKELSEGKIDMVIGTHRLLKPDVVFKDLGLLIVDEEQRFGVMQKEKIKKIKPGIDIIYLSATPIPRTLYMSLAGLKDISVIHTPPIGRKEIVTKIIYFDEEKIKKVIQFELHRNGQIFFVHNRIQTIETVRVRLQNLFPDLKICVLHGRIKSEISEKKMIEFLEGKYDLLLSTAIVESGLDMPRVNTIIINEADKFGLADLHQLRGRVGRSEIQGYAYFIVPSRKMTEEAQKRLSALVSYTTLGSGFRLAIRDMEIRGVGNILGKEQSGSVNSIGYHHYVKILNNVVNELQGKEISFEPLLNLRIPGYIPAEYISSGYERTAIYKRIMEVQDEYELNILKEELIDRFGKYPETVENLFIISKIRLQAINLNANEVSQQKDFMQFFRRGELIREISLDRITEAKD